MQTYDAYQLNHNQAAEIDNLIWYFSELFKSELKIAIGPGERWWNCSSLECCISEVDQLTHLENLVEQADLVFLEKD